MVLCWDGVPLWGDNNVIYFRFFLFLLIPFFGFIFTDAIALARQCNVPEILPAAFYALAVQRWRPSPSRPCSFSGSPNQASNSRNFASGTDGGRAHAVLDPMDLRRLVMGREALQDVLVEFVAAPLSVSPCMLPEDETSGNGTMIISEKGSSYWSSGTESKK